MVNRRAGEQSGNHSLSPGKENKYQNWQARAEWLDTPTVA